MAYTLSKKHIFTLCILFINGALSSMIDLNAIRVQLQGSATAIAHIVSGVSPEEARRKPSETGWSILEVICHLDDEERDDFRMRLDLLLHRPGEPWPPIDPEGWARDRKYNERDLGTTLNSFMTERRKSITWLGELDEPDWNATDRHPVFGDMTAGSLLASWAAHDYLHLRQLIRLRFDTLTQSSAPHTTQYAGLW